MGQRNPYFQITWDKFQYTLIGLNIKKLYETGNEWKMDTEKEGFVAIDGRLTVDLELTFTEEDVRELYNWNAGAQFLAICELASGSFPDCPQYSITNKEDFKICVEAKLCVLSCFNYLSESDRARRLLYNVCRFNKSTHSILLPEDQE